MKNSRKFRCLRAAKVSRHETFPAGRGCAANSGEALAVVAGNGVSSDGINQKILPGQFVPIEPQDDDLQT